MSNLESIVPPLELCKQIPDGEFEDSALVWEKSEKYFQATEIIDYEYKVVARDESKGGFPAPTLEEIITTLLTYGWLVKTDSRSGLETFVELYSRTNNMRYAEHAKIACEAALRLWFKVKGINLE